MQSSLGADCIPGKCAKCKQEVYESLSLLDDAYNVWKGVCPHCGAINFLAMTSLRGYSSGGMDLVLPAEEEREANGLPADTPTSGSCGHKAVEGGTMGSQLLNALFKKPEEDKE